MNPFKKNPEVQPDFEYFILFDSKAGIYREPMLSINRHDMLRQLDNIYKDPQQKQNVLVSNAEDFSLFKIGDFSRRTAKINWHEPEHIINLHEIKSAVYRENGPGALSST